MCNYRIYCFDGAGHIHLGEWVVAATDKEAISKARVMTPGAHLREIWLTSRLVARIKNGDFEPA